MTDCMENSNKCARKKVCFVTTIEMTVRAFLLEHIRAMSEIYDVCVIANTENPDFLKPLEINVIVIPVVIERKIYLLHDIKALFRLYWLFRKNGFDVVHSIMTKSGLLGMVAGFLARVPNRVHTFTGQLWVTQSGFKHFFLKSIDRLLAFLATRILVDSNSQRDFIISEGIVSGAKAYVLARGSITGVNTEKFRPNSQARADIRASLGISDSDVVFLFLGRLTRDKGLLDLARAFSKVRNRYNNVDLMVVGPDEEGLRERILEICGAYSDMIYFEDYTNIPESYMAAADVFCLPSYREGFGNVIIEAAATGIPAIGTRIYGVTDTIEDGVTGLLYEPRDAEALASLMERLIKNADLRKEIGMKARTKALQDYSNEKVVSAMLDFYEIMIAGKNNECMCN